MTELGVKGTLCGIGGSMGLEVLDCAEEQASRGPGWEVGKRKREWVPGISIWPVNTPTPHQVLGSPNETGTDSLSGLSNIQAWMINNHN